MLGPTRFKLFLSFSMLAVTACAALAQDGVSSAAAGRTRYLGELGIIPASREVAVEEIVNYHRHQIGRPKVGEAVAMDVRWGNDTTSGNEAVLQIGFSTALANDREQLRPLNLALVIDKSGSMAAADKLSKVKAALLRLLSQLREEDTISIVVFDSEASVALPARRLGDRSAAREVIQSLQPGSSTNIHAGLMLGYQQALKNYHKDWTNRVVLLTDGIANVGVTEPADISRESLGYNDRGIDLSTIGLGLDLNKDLLRDLAKSGRGLFHFVADAQDIEKVFVKEVQSLVSPVATEPNVEIEYDPNLTLVQMYGYEPSLKNGRAKLKLDNMNSGMTQVVLMRFKASSRAMESRLPVTVRLTYYDLKRKKQIVKTEKAFVTIAEGSREEMLADTEVAKNYTIALLAQSIRDMAAACEGQKFRDAEQLLTRAIAKTYKRYPNLEDEDIKRTLMTAQKYQQVLKKQNDQESRDEGRGGRGGRGGRAA